MTNNRDYNTNMESDDDEYQTEDDEYEPIAISGWGDNAPKEKTWDTLIDPSVKVKAGGIGSGDLHRRGGNFKPVSEAFIISQRLSKGVPSKGPKKKKRKPPSASKPIYKPAYKSAPRPVYRPTPNPPKPHVVFAGHTNKPYTPVIRPAQPKREPIKNPSASPWGTQPLVSTAFWESKAAPKPTMSPAKPTDTPIKPTTAPTRPTTTVAAPEAKKPMQTISIWGGDNTNGMRITKLPVLTSHTLPPCDIPPSKHESSPGPNTRWNVEAQVYEPVQKGFSSPDTTPSTPKWNTNVPSFVPTFSVLSPSTSKSSNSTATYNADAPEFIPTFQLPVKKPVKITSPAPSSPAPSSPALSPSPSLPPATTHSNKTTEPHSRVHLDKSLLRKHLQLDLPGQTPAASQKKTSFTSQPKPEATVKEPSSFLQINIAIADGVNTMIDVQEGSDPAELVEEFARTHKLVMSDQAKERFAKTISVLIQNKKAVLSK